MQRIIRYVRQQKLLYSIEDEWFGEIHSIHNFLTNDRWLFSGASSTTWRFIIFFRQNYCTKSSHINNMSFLLTLFLSTLEIVFKWHTIQKSLWKFYLYICSVASKVSKDNSVDFQTLRKLENTQNTGKVEVKLWNLRILNFYAKKFVKLKGDCFARM